MDVIDDIEQYEDAADIPEPIMVPDFGGTMVLSMRNPKTLNPLLNEDETVDRVLSLIFEKLFILDSSNRPLANPALAYGYTLSADARSITVHMRDNIFWADGTRITANDAAFSIDFLRTNAPANAIYRRNVAGITSTTVTGGDIRINLSQPNPYIGYLLGIPIVPQAFYRNISNTHARQMNPVGSGPFAVSDFIQGRELVLAASPFSVREPAFIQTIEVRILDSDSQDLNAVLNGATDAAYVFNRGWSRYANRANIRAAEFVSRQFDFIGFNFSRTIMNSSYIRSIIAHSIPYNILINQIYSGEAVLSPTPVSPAYLLYNDSLTHYEFDLERAAELFDELDTDDITLQILVNVESPERVRIADILTANLEWLGFAIELYVLPANEFVERLNNGAFDIFLGSYNLSPDPDLRFMLHSTNVGNTNILRYRDAVMDRFLQDVINARTEESMLNAYHTIQNYIIDELPLIGLVFHTSALFLGNRVQGFPDTNNIFSNIEDWYIKTREIGGRHGY